MAVIRDVSGAVLAEDPSLDQRELVADLVRHRKSLRRADLSGLDLSRLDLRGASLPEAKLDGADLSHALLDEASMRGASLVGAKLKGARLDDAVCEAVQADGANLSGASLRRTWLLDLRAVGARFDDADLAGADMAGAHVKGSHFQRAVMRDVRLADAELYGNDFREADLTSSDGGLPLSHRPDRALGARAVGNKFSPKAAICPSMKALRRDTWLGWASNASAVGAAGGLGSLAALAVIPNIVDAKVGLDLLSSGMSVIAMTTLPLFLRTVVGGRIKDYVQPHMDKLVLGVAEVLDRTAKAGVAAKDVATLMWSGGTNALQKAVAATREKAGARGWGAAFSALSLGGIKVVFCDRRHLALALQEMSRPRLAGSRGDAETVLVRQGPPGEAPDALRLHSDGATTAVYLEGSVTWSRRGAPTTVGVVPPSVLAGGEFGARQAFEAALFADHGLTPIAKHWFTNHFEAGGDGSLLVVDHVARRVSNPVGPAVLLKDDTTVAVLDGSVWDGPRNGYGGPAGHEPVPFEDADAVEVPDAEPELAPAPR